MQKILFVALLTLSANVYSSEIPESLRVKEYKLDNGLTIWLNEDHSQPKVFGAVVVKAGARDCPDTGIAHYFEHIMFKGTDKIGTVDYESEKVFLDSIAARYDELADEKDVKKRELIQKQINELSVRAADYVIPNEFDRLISRYGGNKLNAGTSYDYTVYFNTFSPQYIRQWAEINSERLVNPVFRLFQSELETVYEEKHMYMDQMGGQAMEKLTHRYFFPHPYAYPIVGSTENLKNPRLSEMRKFFEEYYVASNMGLILSGNFDTEKVLPVLEKSFSGLRKGKAPERKNIPVPPFKGKEEERIKVSIPFVKIFVLAFRGIPANHPDEAAMKIAVGLLNNENGTGYLDKLMVDHKLTFASAMMESLNETGILGVGAVPKLLFQSYSSATKLVWNEIERIKKGDFSDDIFNSLKLESVRTYNSGLEDISSRAQIMMRLFSQGISWEEYVKDLDRISALTKNDVVKAARKYFTKDHLYAIKETGKYPKDDLPKPGFEPIIPKNAKEKSEFAKNLEKIAVPERKPVFLDFDKDVETQVLSPYATLYIKPNQVNNIFSLRITHCIGALEDPMLTQVANYLPFLGTKDMSYQRFRESLQALGASLIFDVDDRVFSIQISGFDENLEPTISLVSSFLQGVNPDSKKMNQLRDGEKVLLKAFGKSPESISSALQEFVKYGKKSQHINKISLDKLKKMNGEELVNAFKEAQKVSCNIHYCGSFTSEEITSVLNKYLKIGGIKRKSNSPFYRPLKTYDKPTVYFYHTSDVSQTMVSAYISGEPLIESDDRHVAKMFSGYFGGDMSSLMFQEIREFRSFAYRAFAKYNIMPQVYSDKPGFLMANLTTQADKTIDAMTVLDSLIHKMPIKNEMIEGLKHTIVNQVNNSYPSFRNISSKIASYKMEGYKEDPNAQFLEMLNDINMDSVVSFYEKNVANRPVVYIVVGNSKKIKMDKLASFGHIIHVKKNDIIK